MRLDLAKIRRLRESKKLTQADMGRALGYKTALGYHYIETGQCKASADQLPIIANLLGVSIIELYTGASKPQAVAGR